MGAGQSSILKVELRRFIELTLWAVYFTDHPVEWQNFSGKRGAGFSRDAHKPISFSAHRELAAYFDYAKEYMEAEPSGIALLSLSRLLADNRQLNAAVHAGEIARSPLRNPPIETFTAAEAEKIASLTKRVLGHAIVVLAAFHKDGFDALPAGAKAHFDWLVGPRIKRQVRSGPFGLALSK
jgi:hypothetical protein